MKISFWPKTVPGGWAAALWIGIIVLVILKLIAMKFGTGLPVPSLAIAALGVGGFASGLTAVIKKDRSILVFLSTLTGLLFILWIIAELIFPH